MREGHAELLSLDRQRRCRQASHRPADEHHTIGLVDPLAGEVHRAQQIGATAVCGIGIPVGRNNSQTMSGYQLSERPDRGTRICLLAVPQQNGRLRGFAEDIRQYDRRRIRRSAYVGGPATTWVVPGPVLPALVMPEPVRFRRRSAN